METNDGYFFSNECKGYGIIYRATNKITGKCYIGQTIKKLKDRIARHYCDAKRHKYKFANALRKYKKSDWEWEVLESYILELDLDKREVYIVDKHDPKYNTVPGGKGGCRGDKSPSKKPEVRAKISRARKGQKSSAEAKAKISRATSGKKNPMYGKKHTKKTLKKMSDNNCMHRKECREKSADTKSHWWQITFPDGHVEVIKNLRAFCRKHGLLQSNMHAVATGKKKSCKRFRCDKIKKQQLGGRCGQKNKNV